MNRNVKCSALAGAAGLVLVAALPAVAQARPSDGFYTTLASERHSAQVELAVIKHGSAISRHRDGFNCAAKFTPPFEGVLTHQPISIPFPKTLSISRSGHFSYAGMVTLTPADTQSTYSARSSFKITGHFASLPRGGYPKEKIGVVTGTVHASLCEPSTPASFSLVYAPGA